MFSLVKSSQASKKNASSSSCRRKTSPAGSSSPEILSPEEKEEIDIIIRYRKETILNWKEELLSCNKEGKLPDWEVFCRSCFGYHNVCNYKKSTDIRSLVSRESIDRFKNDLDKNIDINSNDHFKDFIEWCEQVLAEKEPKDYGPPTENHTIKWWVRPLLVAIFKWRYVIVLAFIVQIIWMIRV
jgi:hypothetical protein